MRQSVLKLLILSTLLLTLVMLGCSDDDSPTGTTQTGSTNDPNFLAMEDFTEDGDVFESWSRSFDMTFALLDHQFPPSALSSQTGLLRADAAQDSIIVEDASYSFTNGWHIWQCSLTVYDGGDVTVVTARDSVQIWANDEIQADSLDTLDLQDADTIKIGVVYQWVIVDSDCSGGGSHEATLTQMAYGTLGALVINVDVDDTLHGAAGCISDNCTLLLTWSLGLDNMVFPWVQVMESQEPADCPADGSLAGAIGLDLQCSGEGDPRFDTLSVNGTWSVTVDVRPNNELEIKYTFGSIEWTVIDTCVEDGGPGF